MHISEYGRAVHAEIDGLLAYARNGVRVKTAISCRRHYIVGDEQATLRASTSRNSLLARLGAQATPCKTRAGAIFDASKIR